MYKILNLIKNQLFDLISPPFCVNCKKFISQRTPFCIDCLSQVKIVASVKLRVTENYAINVFAVSDYQYPFKSLVLAKQSSNYLASTQLAELIWDMSNIKNIKFDYLTPIPLHWSRYIKRGYNQSEAMALTLSGKSGKPVADILNRTKKTEYQFFLKQQQRLNNLKGAFELKPDIDLNRYTGSHIMLVDDLLTSGATLSTAAKEIIKLKPLAISAVVGCRVT